MSKKGHPSWKKGIKYTEEQKAKLDMSGLEKGRGWNKGKHWSQEIKDRIRKGNIGNIVTPETRLKISQKHKGKKKPWVVHKRGAEHHWWKGGITPEHQKIRRSVEYRIWQKAVKERDNYVCIWCGS